MLERGLHAGPASATTPARSWAGTTAGTIPHKCDTRMGNMHGKPTAGEQTQTCAVVQTQHGPRCLARAMPSRARRTLAVTWVVAALGVLAFVGALGTAAARDERRILRLATAGACPHFQQVLRPAEKKR